MNVSDRRVGSSVFRALSSKEPCVYLEVWSGLADRGSTMGGKKQVATPS